MALIDFDKLRSEVAKRLPGDTWTEETLKRVAPGGRLDAKAFGQAVVSKLFQEMKPELMQAAMQFQDLQDGFSRLAEDTQKTLEEAAQETDAGRLVAIQWDLELTLPARRSALISSVESRIATAAKAALEETLDFVIKVALATAKALVLGR